VRIAYQRLEADLKRTDLAAFVLIALVVAFFIYEPTRALYVSAYNNSPIIISFIKFAFLATFGELLVLRIRKGIYYKKEFGLFPKMMIWGVLGIFIYFAFAIFSVGVSNLFKVQDIPILNAFLISLFMNIIFAPVMMLIHHLTDLHITQESGKFAIKSFSPLSLFKSADWDKMWSFVYKKTIPFFWIPAHTVTFLLPSQFRTLFAAVLSVALGLLLAFSTGKNKKE